MAVIPQEVIHRGIDNLGFLPLKLQLDRRMLVTLKPVQFSGRVKFLAPLPGNHLRDNQNKFF